MSIEELKLLIDAASSAGEGVFWLVIAYLGQGYLSSILCLVGVLVLAVLTARTVRMLWSANQFAIQVRRAAGIYCQDWEPVSAVHIEEVVNKLRAKGEK